jgi:hypothetical protein
MHLVGYFHICITMHALMNVMFLSACRTTITANKELHIVQRCVSRTKYARWPSSWKINTRKQT